MDAAEEAPIIAHRRYALAFWRGGKEVASGDMTFEDMLKVCFQAACCMDSSAGSRRLSGCEHVEGISRNWFCFMALQVFFAIILTASGISQSQMVCADSQYSAAVARCYTTSAAALPSLTCQT